MRWVLLTIALLPLWPLWQGSGLVAHLPLTRVAQAATRAEEIRAEIEHRSGEIARLEEEITGYQKEIAAVGKEKASLENTVAELNLSRRKLEADITVTEKKIDRATLRIQELGRDIGTSQLAIQESKEALTRSLRSLNEAEGRNPVAIILSRQTLSQAWNEVESLEQFRSRVAGNITYLQEATDRLQTSQEREEGQRRDLDGLRSELVDRQTIIGQTKREKDRLLAQTKNKESAFKELLEEKQALKDAFEQELFELESALELAVDESALPPAGSGVLRWPLKDIVVTQEFGDTAFAQGGAYSGRGHNGVDFRAAPGTAVYAAGSGTVIGTGDTDAVPGCYSYGRWVMVEHPNGLSTLYAHLSLIKAEAGERVSVGDLLGYSGNTGYSTGPHLHLGVYASQGTRIVRLGDIKKITNCAEARIPVADLKAYLNPLTYL